MHESLISSLKAARNAQKRALIKLASLEVHQDCDEAAAKDNEECLGSRLSEELLPDEGIGERKL